MAAIRNVIFDLGGVLLEWRPIRILERSFPDKETQDVVGEALFRHPDWRAFNRGDLSEEHLVERVGRRTGMGATSISRVLDVVRDSLIEIPETVEVINALHRRGVPLYCLSDMPDSVYSYVRERYTFWSAFQGIVISGQVCLMKPEQEVFEYLLNRFGLSAAETAFVDDHPPNIEGARAVGLEAIHFESAEQCLQALDRRLYSP